MWPLTLPGILLLTGAILGLAGVLAASSKRKPGSTALGAIPAWAPRVLIIWGVLQVAIAAYLFMANPPDDPPPVAPSTPVASPTATAVGRAPAIPTVATEPMSTAPPLGSPTAAEPPTAEPSETPEPSSIATLPATQAPPPTEPATAQSPARSIQFSQDGPQLSPDTSCTRISWAVEGYLRVYVFLDGTPEGELREAVGRQDLCPGKDKSEEVHILRAYYSETEFDERRVAVPIQ